ncbi:alpha/beta fold hydrolase [Aestuariibacter sp. AA17]|uniref:Alpha/beta fold hydrolase n=1 Tax=Fluctibacter corallii TaxID=2984329 RepID=A0ABT3AD16_9ALTE|nr:alpha/beta fold hydrolase [Aestuariibacter sp. AA17]MCV2886560.1 alpha/beta fold hydrolase [Aestuariibacter sp. AA17]
MNTFTEQSKTNDQKPHCHLFQIKTNDVHTITATDYLPIGEYEKHVIIAPAMGVHQQYYADFAAWLASQGVRVTTFDYRGMGQSQSLPIKDYAHDILDWATVDCSCVLSHVLSQSQDKAVYWLGHSLGGQIFPLINGIHQVEKVITVASGTGYWRYNAAPLNKIAWLLWYVIVPVSTQLWGYYPGKRINLIGDLPKNVMRQWRRWCLHPKYCVGVESSAIKAKFNDISVPLDSLFMADDEMLSQKNWRDLVDLFGMQQKQKHLIHPAEFGEKRIGHLGFFKKRYAQSVWEPLLPTLLTKAK